MSIETSSKTLDAIGQRRDGMRSEPASTKSDKKQPGLRPSDVLPRWRISGRIRDCHRLLNTELQRRFSAFGIVISDWLHMRNIAECEGLTQVELSRQLRMEKASSTAVLQKLRAMGFIVGRRMTSDRRKIGIFLTPKGKRLVEKLIPNVLVVIEAGTAGIADKDMEIMVRTLDKVMQNLEAPSSTRSER